MYERLKRMLHTLIHSAKFHYPELGGGCGNLTKDRYHSGTLQGQIDMIKEHFFDGYRENELFLLSIAKYITENPLSSEECETIHKLLENSGGQN